MEKSIQTCTALENVLYENVKLLESRKLSEIEYLGTYNTNSTVFSTGNAPQNLHVDHCMMTDTTHAESKQGSKKRKRGTENPQNPSLNKNLTPVTILVVDTIGTIKSRKLLKVLLDSGSTTTLINKKSLPRLCKPCQISQNRIVSTLAGSYQTSAMVVMRNIRLPELDKNRNIRQ